MILKFHLVSLEIERLNSYEPVADPGIHYFSGGGGVGGGATPKAGGEATISPKLHENKGNWAKGVSVHSL